MRLQLYVAFILIVRLGFACHAPTEPSNIQSRFDTLSKAEEMALLLPSTARAAIIGALYDELFTSARANQTSDSINDETLHLLYDAATLAEYYTINDRYILDMQTYLGVLQERRLASDRQVAQLYQALVSARRLTEANDIARSHPQSEMKILPAVREATGFVSGTPTELVLDLNRHELLRRSVDMHQPAQIVVVGHPLCHFTQNAIQDIETDPVLGSIFRAHARWLAPQTSAFDWGIFEQWNRSHPELEIALAFRREEWTMIDTWNLPTFYFFKDGTLRSKLFGWPAKGRRSELLAALRLIGLVQ